MFVLLKYHLCTTSSLFNEVVKDTITVRICCAGYLSPIVIIERSSVTCPHMNSHHRNNAQKGIKCRCFAKTIHAAMPACISIYMEAEGINSISSLEVLYGEMSMLPNRGLNR